MAAPTVIAGMRPAPEPRGARRAGRVLRAAGAVGAGGLLYLCAPPRELWWLAPLAFALWWLVLHRGPGLQREQSAQPRSRWLTSRSMQQPSGWAGLGYGFAFGVGFFVPLLPWIGEFVGPLPWLALATFEALVLALAGSGVAVVSRLPAAPLWAAGVWVAAEALIARWPFAGFPWGRVAFGQPSGLFLPIAAIGGAPLLSAAVVLAGFGLGELLRRAARRHQRHQQQRHQQQGHRHVGRRDVSLGAPALLTALPVVAGLAAAPLVGTTAMDGYAVAAVIQGNVPRAGLDFNAQRRVVLDNHGSRTEQLAAAVAAGYYPQPDLVIWPENSSDIDPLRNPDARAVIDRAARAIRAPILVGAVVQSHDGRPSNTALVWDPATGPGERHDKRRLQPFGEYMPYREFFRLFSPYVDRASNFKPGFGDGAVDLGPARVGVATCYEVVFDDLVRDSVRAGAQLLAVPTNNATFGFTEMTYQQQAMSRVRAVEHDRAVLVAATSGVSSVIAPDGTIKQSTALFTPGALVAHVSLRSGTTLATRLGPGPEWGLTALGALGMGVALIATRREIPKTTGLAVRWSSSRWTSKNDEAEEKSGRTRTSTT